MTLSQPSIGYSPTGADGPPIPALLTAICSAPNRFVASRTSASLSAALATSARKNTASAPPDVSRRTVSAPPSSSTSDTTTRAPASASFSATARPMPLPAPVTIATLFSSMTALLRDSCRTPLPVLRRARLLARAEPLQIFALPRIEALRSILLDFAHDPVELLAVHRVQRLTRDAAPPLDIGARRAREARGRFLLEALRRRPLLEDLQIDPAAGEAAEMRKMRD